jgi:hypothetical protein
MVEARLIVQSREDIWRTKTVEAQNQLKEQLEKLQTRLNKNNVLAKSTLIFGTVPGRMYLLKWTMQRLSIRTNQAWFEVYERWVRTLRLCRRG